jgi:hypothetical protein
VTDLTTMGGSDGSIAVTATGGTSPYYYQWSNGQTAATATGLSAGTYTVSVSDAHSCLATTSASINEPTSVAVRIKVFLQGPYMVANHLMTDSLRVHRYIPETEPYSSPPYSQKFVHTGGGGGETVTGAAVFDVTGPNALVDWVFVELRDRSDKTLVVNTRAGLVQRDGDVVDVDGVSPLAFTGLTDTRYYVSVRHRNHLGVMTAIAKTISIPDTINFTNGTEEEFNWGTQHPGFPGIDYTGLSQSVPETGKRAMWYGDTNEDRKVIYDAVGDEQSNILSDVHFNPGNTSKQCGYDFCKGYYAGDVDLNGKVKFEPPYDDRSMVLYQILFYPLNSSYQGAYVNLVEQLP